MAMSEAPGPDQQPRQVPEVVISEDAQRLQNELQDKLNDPKADPTSIRDLQVELLIRGVAPKNKEPFINPQPASAVEAEVPKPDDITGADTLSDSPARADQPTS